MTSNKNRLRSVTGELRADGLTPERAETIADMIDAALDDPDGDPERELDPRKLANTMLAHRGVALRLIADAVGLPSTANPREIVDAVQALAARAQPKDKP